MSDADKEAKPADERVWEQGWEGHKQLQRQRMAQMTMAEKLEWLEEAHRLVLQMRKGSGGTGARESESKRLEK